ncbi:MAG: type II/IV secretion system protein [Clostridia bacterium]|nr:type II/IV secretion system protein [Clostridia bacterium]
MAIKKVPIGIELVRRKVATEADIKEAIRYQKEHPNVKIGEALAELGRVDEKELIQAMGEILGEKVIIMKPELVNVNISKYISMDMAKKNNVIPFDDLNGKVKVCFSDTSNTKLVEQIRLMLMHNGYSMEKYISFTNKINETLEQLDSNSTTEDLGNTANKDITKMVDTIIKTGMEKNASDIHIEPMEKDIRVRYRIDGDLITVARIGKENQSQMIGRLKAISNMYQEKQESQDGRIIMYPGFNIRVSSQKTIYGEKFVLRLLKKDAKIRDIYELGFPRDENLITKYFDKRNSVTIVAAPTGEGKTTTLYSIIKVLNTNTVNIITLEDPVEVRLPGLNQVEMDAKTTFASALRTVLRQDPNIVLVGEIRDLETAEIALEAGQTGHYVLSTIHTINSIEVITRLRKLGISDYDIASTLATAVSQRLVRKVCPHCAQKREFTEEEKRKINTFSKKYNMEFDFTDKYTWDTIGCKECNMTGYSGRIAIIEILTLTDKIKELVMNGKSTFEIRKAALEEGFLPFEMDGVKKVVDGLITVEELNNKTLIFNNI